MASEIGYGTASHAVVGLPGAVDYEAGRFLWAPNLPTQWPEQLSADRLECQLGFRSASPTMPTWPRSGEAWFGAGAAERLRSAYLTISTGIGAGVVNGGRMLRGTRSLAEVGHAVIDWRAWRDGEPSTVEELGSGSGVARLAREAGLGASSRGGRGRRRGTASPGGRHLGAGHRRLRRRRVEPGHVLLPEHRRHRRRHGQTGRRSSARCATWCCSDPAITPATLPIVRSTLGDDAGLSGAAAWARATEQPG